MHAPLNTLDELAAVLADSGKCLYGGEAVSQLAHALQGAQAAEQDGASPALIVATLLHDLGHLVCEQGDDDIANGINDHHEAVAVQVLRRLFGDEVLQPIALHVAAKRYLCASDPAYLAGLSPASRASLALQGGTMDSHCLPALLHGTRYGRRRTAAAPLRRRRQNTGPGYAAAGALPGHGRHPAERHTMKHDPAALLYRAPPGAAPACRHALPAPEPTSASALASSRCCASWTSISPRASLSACWARPAAARPRCCARSPAWTPPTAAASSWPAATSPGCRQRRATTASCSRVTRCFPT